MHLEPNSFNPKVIPAKGITELDRLSFVVHTIEHQCQIVPFGSYKKTPLGEVKRNEAYRGRKLDELKDLSQYAHLRPVFSREKIEQAARKEDIFVHDFLDNVSKDNPKGIWTIIAPQNVHSVVTLRNKLWPGFSVFARANTPIYGSVYLGNGICDNDFLFMV